MTVLSHTDSSGSRVKTPGTKRGKGEIEMMTGLEGRQPVAGALGTGSKYSMTTKGRGSRR